jgi:RNA polymerase sigma-70 factor (ECF subfamily)
MTEDDQLMIRIQSGEACAFEELVNKYQSALHGFFYRNTRDAQLAEDLSQETLLRVFNQSWDYLPVGRFRGWMYRIGRNLMIDNIRRQSHDALVRAVKGAGKDEQDMLARIAGEFLSPEEKASQHELAAMVNELLEEIPAEQRLTFTLHHFSGLSLPEVADVTETTTATAKSRLRLAREKLQLKLKRRGLHAPNVGRD